MHTAIDVFRQLTCRLLFLCLCTVAPAAIATDSIHLNMKSVGGHFSVSLRPESGDVPIGETHTWILRVTDKDGKAVYPARLAVGGGMATHGHGLPTRPLITDHLGDGEYRIEGMQFNMAGEWTLRIGIEFEGVRDIAETAFELDF